MTLHTRTTLDVHFALGRVAYRLAPASGGACDVARNRAGERVLAEDRARVMGKLQAQCTRRGGCTCVLVSEAWWRATHGREPEGTGE